MASSRIIKRRIKSAKNIAQITKAMQMVAASKMKRAQNQALNTRPYANELLTAVNSLKGKVDASIHPLLASVDQGAEAVVLIAPDKGLCGSLVTNLSKLLLQINKNSSFIILGKKGRDASLRLGFNIEAYFDLGISQPKYEIVPPIAETIINGFRLGKYSKVSVVYTKFINTLSQKATMETILPLSLERILAENEQEDFQEYLFEPNANEVLDALLPHYVEMELYQIILESYASEQSARMIAMKNASDNAKEIINELTLSYNKIRQNLITNEIADIATAAMVVGN